MKLKISSNRKNIEELIHRELPTVRNVKIFLASSAELDADKLEFELFISRKNKDLQKKHIFLELTTWKDFISSIREGRTQDEYNKYIRKSDISIFLFHTKLGRYTREEFDNAHQAFLNAKGKHKKPRIYTYFKTNEEELSEISQFRDYVDSLDHFYDTYNNLDDLFVKFNGQLDKLENEGKILSPNYIDTSKTIKYAVYYFLIPLLVLAGAAFSYYYFQPLNMTVKISEPNPISGLVFERGTVSLTYGDKTETSPIQDEVIFKQIPSKYKHATLKLHFTAQGYESIDSLVNASDLVTLSIKRNNSLGTVFGWVRDAATNQPLKDVNIDIKGIKTLTNESGRFRIDIPREQQAESVRLLASKPGYQLFDWTGNPSQTVEWQIMLEK